jgi:hypothetical protein
MLTESKLKSGVRITMTPNNSMTPAQRRKHRLIFIGALWSLILVVVLMGFWPVAFWIAAAALMVVIVDGILEQSLSIVETIELGREKVLWCRRGNKVAPKREGTHFWVIRSNHYGRRPALYIVCFDQSVFKIGKFLNHRDTEQLVALIKKHGVRVVDAGPNPIIKMLF